MALNELAKRAHENAVSKGWWQEERPFAEQIALMHSELSETLEEYRDGRGFNEVYYSCPPQADCSEAKSQSSCDGCPHNKPEGIPIELADVIIRILDTCGQYGIDIEEAIQIKMAFNKTRPYKHGGKRI